MFNPWSLTVIALSYVGVLFAIAWVGDRRRTSPNPRNLQAAIYSLSLAVYCTSWTFYGAVGTAATTGWGYLPIYLGPALVFLLGHEVIRRIAVSARDQRITSIADYIAYRYGRSHSIAVLVTVAAVIGSVPYIALQLKAITTGFDVVAGFQTGVRASSPGTELTRDISLYLALALSLFSILFGTRTMDASEHHRGLMWAISFESLVKLLAFLAIGLFAVFGVFDGFGDIAANLRDDDALHDLFSPWRLPEGFGIQLVLASVAILCLPRQFHVTVVEFRREDELRMARWVFPGYLMLFAAMIIPITLAGLTQFAGQEVNPDSYVLALPIAFDQEALTVLAFLGGFSAATGMVIVATVALAIMVSNDIVMPLLLRTRFGARHGSSDLSRTLLRVRRISILLITLVAYLYYRGTESGVPLASIGLLSFSAAAQFAPALFVGLFWPRASRTGAMAGLIVGGLSWLFLLLLPSLAVSADLVPGGQGIPFNDAAAWSLALNFAAVLLGSWFVPDRIPESSEAPASPTGHGLLTLGDLQQTIGRFLGMGNAQEALASHLGSLDVDPAALATPGTVQFGERLLAGSIGSASARTVLTAVLFRRGLGAQDALELLDRTSQAVQFNRELLESTLNLLPQGVAVVDRDLRLVGWNQRYLELMQYPAGLVSLGQPIEELFRFNAKRGLLAGGVAAAGDIRKRVERLRGGAAYRFERSWLEGKVIEIEGNPMPGGGYVTTFTDITHFKEIERKLQEVNETLEQRVLQRTRELSDAVREVEDARQAAEAANFSKTRFLAAASHDLLQPMNAARLFVSILRLQVGADGEQGQLIKRVDRSLSAAEELLSALLDISKLDSGMLRPELESIPVAELFEQLRRRFKPLASNRDLELRIHDCGQRVYSDRKLLSRILQNFLSNAIRYTESGGVLLGCRKRGNTLVLSVWDTGVGVDEQDRELIFQEFQRLDYARRLEDRGLGLGLAICDRIARMLGHELSLNSQPGRGSCFSVSVPLASELAEVPRTVKEVPAKDLSPLDALSVLCVDNEPDILDGMRMLLERWGCTVQLARSYRETEEILDGRRPPDMLLVDYHLDEAMDGLQLLAAAELRLQRRVPSIVITADRSADLEDRVRELGYGLLRKPIKPAALRALMTNTLKSDSQR